MLALLIAPILTSLCHAGEPPAPKVTPAASIPPAATNPGGVHLTAREPFKQAIPAAAYSIELRPVPGSADGTIKPFFMSATEITWDAFDTYIYRLDDDAGKAPPATVGAVAVTRPSKPYLPPDRGFGHEGYPAMTMSFENAKAFCVWLSAHSGKTYRLPTEQEWEHAARGGATAPATERPATEKPATEKPDTEKPATEKPATEKPAADKPATEKPSESAPAAAGLGETSWFEANSDASTHPVAKKKANALGLFDMLGNVREWCVGPDGKGVARGGGYIDPAEKVTVTAREPSSPKWNASDPQIPKSTWWLADGPFVGFRIVCEDESPAKPDAKTK